MSNFDEIDEIDIYIDTAEFTTDPIELIKYLRIKLKEENIPFVTIGRFKEEIYIYLKDLSIKNKILNLLTEDQKKIVFFERS